MQMTLPKDLATLEATTTKNRTRVDNVFCSEGMSGRVWKCRTREEEQVTKTDHFPVETVLDVGAELAETRKEFIFRATDWDKFRLTLQTKLDAIPEPREFRRGQIASFLMAKDNLERVIRETTEEVVPRAKELPWKKRWWNSELGKMRKEVRKLAAEAIRGDDAKREEYRRRRNDYAQAIRREKRAHWEEWLENLDEKDVWAAGKLVGGSGDD
ncbi:hypothetical protein BJ165DRAFT_1324228, partial [Panaeolus papilionaceus]